MGSGMNGNLTSGDARRGNAVRWERSLVDANWERDIYAAHDRMRARRHEEAMARREATATWPHLPPYLAGKTWPAEPRGKRVVA